MINFNTNKSGLGITNFLNKNNSKVSSSLQKLSSGLKINSGKDDPSGLVISQLLQSDYAGLTRALQNTQETNNVLSIASGGVSEISSQLRDMRQYALHAMNSGVTSNEQVSADQAAVNSRLGTIARTASNTNYSSSSLLNGSKSINASATNTSADQTRYDAAELTSSATVDGTLAADQDFTVTGETGSQNFTFAAGDSLDDVVGQINDYTDSTGVTAALSEDGNSVVLNSTAKGSTSFAEVTQNTGDLFAAAGDTVREDGADVAVSAEDQQQMLDMRGSDIRTVRSTDGMNMEVQFSGEAADQAEKAYVESNFGGGQQLSSAQSFTVGGAQGQQDFEFGAGTSISEMADIINQSSGNTGVTAYAINDGTELRLVSEDYGSDQTVTVDQASGDGFARQGSSVSDTGQDLTITVGGQKVTGDGLTVQVQNSDFSGTLEFNSGTDSTATSSAMATVAQLDYSQDTLTDAASTKTERLDDFTGGMNLQLGNTSTGSDSQVIGISDVSLNSLGRITRNGETYSLSDLFSGGAASLSKDPSLALDIIDQAIKDASSLNADIGAYQANTLESTSNSLAVAMENIVATGSYISDSDMARESTEYTKNLLMDKVGVAMLAQSKSMNASIAQKLLGGM